MKCPICDVEMRLSIREEIEIDYCPQCRGVWLDRGELEKVIANIVIQYPSELDNKDNKHDKASESPYERSDNSARNEIGDRNKHSDRNSPKREGFFSNLMELFGGD